MKKCKTAFVSFFLEETLSQSVHSSVRNYRLGYKRDEVGPTGTSGTEFYWCGDDIVCAGVNKVFRNIKGIQNMCFLFIYILRPETRAALSEKKSKNCRRRAK